MGFRSSSKVPRNARKGDEQKDAEEDGTSVAVREERYKDSGTEDEEQPMGRAKLRRY